MSLSTSPSCVQAAIASETITGGGLAHYTEDLDRIMRAHAAEDCVMVESPYISPLQGSRYTVRSFLGRLPLVRAIRSRLRGGHTRDPWPDAAAWTEIWRNRPRDLVAIIPHVVINDGGHLNQYYAAITEHPFVLVVHDLHALHFPQEWKPADVETLKSRFSMLAHSASQIIVHNDFTAQDVVDKLGVNRDRITVVLLPAFFEETAFQGSPEADRVQLAKLDIAMPYALWASSSTFAHKNHKRLLQAWRLLTNRGHALQLICTGSREPHWDEIEPLIKTENLGSLVRFTGIINDTALAAVMRNAHLAICPTLFEGGGPGPAAEAALAGIPLTISSIPQCRQLFNSRTDLCTFFDPYSPEAMADAVEEIIFHYEDAVERARRTKAQYPGLRTAQSTAAGYWDAVLVAHRSGNRQ